MFDRLPLQLTFLLQVVPVVLALSGHWPAVPPDRTVSNESTWLRQPLCEDGREDYVTGLDYVAREGVTPANNLAVAVMRASGPPWPDREAVPERDALFRALEIEPLPLTGDYYVRENGVFPESLDDLVPTFTQAIPRDRFSDSQLIYQRTDKGYLLYSVGPNLKDDSGKKLDERNAADDIAVRCAMNEP